MFGFCGLSAAILRSFSCPYITQFSGSLSRHVTLHSEPIVHPLETSTCRPTELLHSNTLLSPTFLLLMTAPISNMLPDPMYITCFSAGAPVGGLSLGSSSLTMWTSSSMTLLSPMMMGPASAMILALGCTKHLCPIEISPFSSASAHTCVPAPILNAVLIPPGAALWLWDEALEAVLCSREIGINLLLFYCLSSK